MRQSILCLSVLLLASGCDVLWHPFREPNPVLCGPGGARDCGSDMDMATVDGDGYTGPLLGDTTLEAYTDYHNVGLADASNYVAVASGMVRNLTVYYNGGDVTKLMVGLYTDSGGHPNRLLAQGLIADPVVGNWNTAAVTPVAVTAGQTYWIAILGPVGSGAMFQFQYITRPGPITEHSVETTLADMPAIWTSGQIFPGTICSFYASP